MAEVVEIIRRSLHDEVASRLRAMLVEGRIPPGAKLNERELCGLLRVSRTPLRIALATLAHEGLLEPLRGGGFVVRSFTRADIADGIELRGVLEGTAARFAAATGSLAPSAKSGICTIAAAAKVSRTPFAAINASGESSAPKSEVPGAPWSHG